MNSTGLVRRLEKQLYDHEAFKKADRMERIFIYLASGGEISPYQISQTEKNYLEKMRRAYALLFEHRSLREAIKIFRAEEGSTKGNEWTAPKIMHNAQLMFGHFEEVNRRVQRGMIRESLLLRLKAAEEMVETAKADPENTGRDFAALEKVVQGYLKQLADLDDLKTRDGGQERDTTIPVIEFTNDPESLYENEESADATILN